MRRRCLLSRGAAALPVGLAGCLAGSPNVETPGAPPPTPVAVVARDDQPDAPVEYDVEMAEPAATDDHSARVRVTLTNPTDATVVLGEERAVQFHHVASEDRTLYLHPVGDGATTAPVETGCWRLTDHVAVPEYYGTIAVDAGGTVTAESFVYGHPDLPAEACLPDGEHRVRTSGVAGDSEDAVLREEGERTAFEWGFALRVGE